MEMAQSLERYLRSMDVAFSIHPHEMETSLSKLCSEMGIGPEQTAVPIVLRTQKQAFLMAVVPLDHSLDLDRLSGLLRREFLYLDGANS